MPTRPKPPRFQTNEAYPALPFPRNRARVEAVTALHDKTRWNLEANLLSCALRCREVIRKATADPGIDPSDFTRPPHANLWRRLVELDARTDHGIVDEAWTQAVHDHAYDWGAEVDFAPYVVQLSADARLEAWRHYATCVKAESARLAAKAAVEQALSEINHGEPLEGVHERLQQWLDGGGTSARGRARGVRGLPWTTPDQTWLATDPPRREYLLHDRDGSALGERGPGMLARGKVAILAATGGVGKTFALCGLALAVVTRTRWLGHFPVGERLRRRVVLVLAEEDPAELRRRLHVQARAMELEPGEHGEALAGLHLLPGAGLDTLALTRPVDEESTLGTRTAFATGLYGYLEANAGPGWDAVILDPLSRFAGPDVETDNSAATRLIQVLEQFTKLPGEPAVIVAHHTRKPGTGDTADHTGAAAVRGSSALVDGSRWVAKLDAVPRPGGAAELPGHARFAVVKSNYGAFPRSYPSDGLLLTRSNGGGVRAATPEEAADLARAVEAAAARSKAAKSAKATTPPIQSRPRHPDA